MNGSAKQIAWAEEIRDTFASRIKTAITQANSGKRILEDVCRTAFEESGIEALESALNNLMSVEDAKWFIDNRNSFPVVFGKEARQPAKTLRITDVPNIG